MAIVLAVWITRWIVERILVAAQVGRWTHCDATSVVAGATARRDGVYGESCRRRVAGHEHRRSGRCAGRASPWQNPVRGTSHQLNPSCVSRSHDPASNQRAPATRPHELQPVLSSDSNPSRAPEGLARSFGRSRQRPLSQSSRRLLKSAACITATNDEPRQALDAGVTLQDIRTGVNTHRRHSPFAQSTARRCNRMSHSM